MGNTPFVRKGGGILLSFSFCTTVTIPHTQVGSSPSFRIKQELKRFESLDGSLAYWFQTNLF